MHPAASAVRRGRLLRVAALALPLLLPACTSGETAANTAAATDVAAAPSTSPASALDPCALLSADEVSAAAGIGTSTGESYTSGGAPVCSWTDASGKGAIVQLHPTVASYEESRMALESLYRGSAEELSGVADKAFYIGGQTQSVAIATVSVLKGQRAASVQVMAIRGDAGALRSQVMALTQLLLPKL